MFVYIDVKNCWIVSYLLNDEQRLLLGIKYLELANLEPIKIAFLEGGEPV